MCVLGRIPVLYDTIQLPAHLLSILVPVQVSTGTFLMTILFDQALSPCMEGIAVIMRLKGLNVVGTFLFYPSSPPFLLDFFLDLLFWRPGCFGDWSCCGGVSG